MFTPSASPASHWWIEPQPPFPPLDSEIAADVVIVGGGISGITLAWTLIEHDAKVALLEAGPLAGAASARNAGFLMASPSEPYVEQIEFWGRPGARAMLETGRRNHERIRSIIQTLGIECDYRAAGSARLARDPDEAEALRASLPLLQADGFPMREMPVADAVPGDAASGFAAAFLMAEDGELDPVRFLHGVARAAEARGARIHAGSQVTAARWSNGEWEVTAGAGIARARALVLATNAYSPSLCPALTPLIVPRRGQMLSTAPLSRVIAPRPTYAHGGYQYWRQLPDSRLLIGGWRDLDLDGESGYETEPTPMIQGAIERGLLELVPEGVAIERRWAGTMGFARDGRPLVGWLDPTHHLALCAGFTGHGMGMAAACTRDLAELLSWKKAPGIITFDPGRFAELQHGRDGFVTLGVPAVR
jgi:gamma-glutamylputrescine oxidase